MLGKKRRIAVMAEGSFTPLDAKTALGVLRYRAHDTSARELAHWLARRDEVAQVLAKDEGRRMLGSFKSLGGTYAGLRALARAAEMDLAGLIAGRPTGQSALICARAQIRPARRLRKSRIMI